MRLDEIFSFVHKNKELANLLKSHGISAKHWFKGPVEFAEFGDIQIEIDHETADKDGDMDVMVRRDGKLMSHFSTDTYDKVISYLVKNGHAH